MPQSLQRSSRLGLRGAALQDFATRTPQAPDQPARCKVEVDIGIEAHLNHLGDDGRAEAGLNGSRHRRATAFAPTDHKTLCTAYARLRKAVDIESIYAIYREYYHGTRFVRVVQEAPSISSVTGSNFCEIGLAVKAALREADLRVPDDISMVGFDDIPWAQYSDPPLTTVRLPAQELARTACLVLMDLLEGIEPPAKRQILDTKLVVRKSCRKI